MHYSTIARYVFFALLIAAVIAVSLVSKQSRLVTVADRSLLSSDSRFIAELMGSHYHRISHRWQPSLEWRHLAYMPGRGKHNWRQEIARRWPPEFDASAELADEHYSSLFTLALEPAALASERRYARILCNTCEGSLFDEISKHSSDINLYEIDSTHELADVIMLIEVASSRILWSDIGDFRIDLPKFTSTEIRQLGVDPAGFHVCFADGEVWKLRENVPPAILRRFLTVKDARKSDRDQILSEYRLARYAAETLRVNVY